MSPTIQHQAALARRFITSMFGEPIPEIKPVKPRKPYTKPGKRMKRSPFAKIRKEVEIMGPSHE